MKNFTLTKSGRQMEVSVYNGTMMGQQTVKGLISWTKNNYHNQATWYIISNSNGPRVEVTHHSQISKSMKAFLVSELTKTFIEGDFK